MQGRQRQQVESFSVTEQALMCRGLIIRGGSYFPLVVERRLIAGEFSFAFSACIYIPRSFRVSVFNCVPFRVFSAFQRRRILAAQAKLRPVAIKINSPLN